MATEESGAFGSTVWTLVLAASNDAADGPDLNRLCRKYWRPIYVLARRSGLAPADAEDATQEFFAYFLERSWLKQADAERGRFRAFLYTLFRNFLANYRRAQGALKRTPAAPIVPLDGEAGEAALRAEPTAENDPVRAYERAWAGCLLQAALDRLAAEQAEAGKADAFAQLRPLLGRPRAPGDYERVAAATGWPRGRIAVQVHRLGRRFAELIRIELAETLLDGDDLDAELRHLLAALAA